jgi:t-SNARE complex subunit (syntaxin)
MRELDKAIDGARLRQQSLQRAQQVARAGFEGYAQRIADERRRLAQLQREIEDVVRAHERYLQELVVNELEQQRKRLRGYVTQARFGIAQIYDRSISRPEVGK